MSLRGLARASNYDPSHLSKVLSGHKPSTPYLAARLDDALAAGGTIRDAAQQPPPRRPQRASTPQRTPSGAVQALQVAMTGDPAGPDIGADGLAGLVLHYARPGGSALGCAGPAGQARGLPPEVSLPDRSLQQRRDEIALEDEEHQQRRRDDQQ